MSQPSERRAFERRPLETAVFAYDDGKRFECVPVDYSLGGALLEVKRLDRFKLGGTICVAFGKEADLTFPVYVYAQILRVQEAPISRVGVRWQKAVTSGGAVHLATSLEKLFGLKARLPEDAAASEGRAAFSFAPVHAAAKKHHESGESTGFADEALPNMNVAVAPPEPPAPESEAADVPDMAEAPAPDSTGSITGQLRLAGERVRTHFRGNISVEGKPSDARIRELGLLTMLVETNAAIPSPGTDVTVVFDIPTRQRMHSIFCRCTFLERRSSAEGKPILMLSIADMDEGDASGIVERYLKWLHYKSYARTGED